MSLLSIPSNDLAWSQTHLALGRALYIASGFEHDCRCLTFVLKVQESPIGGQSDEEIFKAVSKAVLARLADLNKLIAKNSCLPAAYDEMLHLARTARNFIAHEASEELVRLMRQPNGVEQWLGLMADKLADIANGKIIVAVLLSRSSAEPCPTTDMIDAYPDKIISWALSR